MGVALVQHLLQRMASQQLTKKEKESAYVGLPLLKIMIFFLLATPLESHSHHLLHFCYATSFCPHRSIAEGYYLLCFQWTCSDCKWLYSVSLLLQGLHTFGTIVDCRGRNEYLLKGWANACESQSITNTLAAKDVSPKPFQNAGGQMRIGPFHPHNTTPLPPTIHPTLSKPLPVILAASGQWLHSSFHRIIHSCSSFRFLFARQQHETSSLLYSTSFTDSKLSIASSSSHRTECGLSSLHFLLLSLNL